MTDNYDVIIVGGGSAGCAAVSRLSEDPTRNVLLFEADPDPHPVPDIVANAAMQTRLLLESPYVAMYPTERNLDGSVFYSLAGKIMGGGSSSTLCPSSGRPNLTSIPGPLKGTIETAAPFAVVEHLAGKGDAFLSRRTRCKT